MFDYIKFEMPCPLCKTDLKNFQSKDGPLQLKTLEVKEVEDFYTNCDKCGLWISFQVSKNYTKMGIEPSITIKPCYIDLQAVNADLLKYWTMSEWRKEENKKFEEKWKAEKKC